MTIRFARSPLIQGAAVVATVVFITTCNDQPTIPPAPNAVPPQRTPTLAVTAEPVVLVAAGNIARCDRTNDEATALLLDAIPGTVAALGDDVYADGSRSDFDACYHPSWGRHQARTRPIPGDEEYVTAGAAGYFSYFGSAAGNPDEGYYSYDVGEWHIVALNSNISTSASSAQVAWLHADLAATTKPCILAYWHHPRFSSYGTAVRTAVKPLWDALYAAQADVVLNAHYRLYERFALQTPTGTADPTLGIRQFTVGTGGHGAHTPGTPQPTSEVRASGIYGLLKLTLEAGTYSWEFVPIAGDTFEDTGTATCHGRPGGPPPPPGNSSPSVNAGNDATISLGGSFGLNGTFTDPNGADDSPWNWTITWGDRASENGSTPTLGGPITPTHTYAAAGTYTVRLTVTDKPGGTAFDELIVSVVDPNAEPVIVGAGDIAGCYQDFDEATAKLLDAIPGTVITLGDNAYGVGSLANFNECYHPTWGRHKARTKPAPGNHDYGSGGAPGYFGYFGAAAGDPTKGYYSYTVGEWLVLSLNSGSSSSDRDADSPQVQWVRAQLASTTRPCVVAYMHHPQFTSTQDRRPFEWNTTDLWNALYEGGVDLVLAAHDHLYERFAPMRPDGTLDLEYGIRQITNGAGGEYLYDFGPMHPHSEIRDNTSFGVVKVTLRPGSFEWEFIPIAGNTFRDSGTGTCHGKPNGSLPPNWLPTVKAGPDVIHEGGSAFQLNATFTDPDWSNDSPWSYTIAWGDGTTPTQGTVAKFPGSITASHIYGSGGQYTVTVTVADGRGGQGSDDMKVTVSSSLPNQAPVANAGGPYTADYTVTFNGSGSDPDSDYPLTYRWTFHDGSTSDLPSPTKSYAADGGYSATLVVTDAEGLPSAPADVRITIANQAPVVNAGTDRTVEAGASLAMSATFTDPGGTADGPWNWFITWGDGASTPDEGSTSTLTSPITSTHTYSSPGQYTVRVTVTDKDGATSADDALVTVTAPGAALVLVGAGNIARCDATNDDATALLLDNIAGTVFTTGDNIHASGTLADYETCYGSETTGWGRHKARTRPSAGDDDYKTAGAAGYFDYFGAAAGNRDEGYYSYDLGNWHIVVLNSNIAMTVGSPQEVWLNTDLAATTKQCVLAYWHHPRFSSYGTGVRSEVKPLWDALYAAGADVVLNGHYRVYERFAPQNPDGVRDDAGGIRQFTIGTGGHGVNTFGTPRPNSEARSSGVYGVLKLTLNASSYSWEFVPVGGQSPTESGTTSCH